MEQKELHWLAGVLEGEGCFTRSSRKAEKPLVPRICVNMSDLDVLEKVHLIMRPGTKISKTCVNNPLGKKTMWNVSVAGRRAAGWMMTLYPLMHKRRQARIKELLTEWKSTPFVTKQIPTCHPERTHQAKGMCNLCYMRNYYNKNKR